AGTVHRANHLAGGRAGFVVDLATAGIEAGAIVRRNGLWRLAGRVPLDQVVRRVRFEQRRLPAPVVDAHRELALAGAVPTSVARDLVGAAAVDHLAATGHLVTT